MMTFYHIQNIDRFFQIIDACVGGVFFQAGNDQYVDIRNNGLVKNLLVASGGQHGVDKLDLFAECQDDRMRLVRYMMDCNNRSSINEKV